MSNLNVKLSEEQQQIVDYDGNELLIRGIAGSGKSLILLKKAKITAENNPDKSIVIFTFNKSLAIATEKLIQKLNITNIEVSTFHKWAREKYIELKSKPTFIKNKNKYIQESIEILKDTEFNDHRFYKESEQYRTFIGEEIAWIKGKGLTDLESYKDASRQGRGSEVRVTKQDREVIYKIYEEYNLRKGNLVDFDDLGLEIYLRLDELKDSDKYDYVFIDEAQDLQQIQLYILRQIAREGIVVAADIGQKIYKTSFTWKDIGLNVRGGRTKVLKDNYRSTKQIMQLASEVQKKDSIVHNDEFVPVSLPNKEGTKPTLVECNSSSEEMEFLLKIINEITSNSKGKSVGVLTFTIKDMYKIGNILKKNSIDYSYLKSNTGDAYSEGVKVSTIHSSKGLQFDVVIIPFLYKYELDNCIDEDEYWDYQRRVLYVGLTRARTLLYLTYHGEMMDILQEVPEELYKKIVVQ